MNIGNHNDERLLGSRGNNTRIWSHSHFPSIQYPVSFLQKSSENLEWEWARLSLLPHAYPIHAEIDKL